MYVRIIMLVMSFFVDTMQASNSNRWIIRHATMDDKDGITQLRKKVQLSYNFQIPNPDITIETMVPINLLSALTRGGIACVVEDRTTQNYGNIIAVIMYQRPMAPSYRHILEQPALSIDPDYKSENLGLHLYQYVLQDVLQNHPDILRIEADVAEVFVENIAIFQTCGFVLEAQRQNAMRLINRKFISDFLYVWMNPNFDENL